MSRNEVKMNFNGKEYSIETGKFAKFANGAVMVKCEDTMVLVTATCSNEEKKDIDFLPLQVEYREKSASAGKIPGGFLKREGRPSDTEILNARLIDRPIRPMIPKTWRYETQLVATVYSADPAVEPDTLAALGASAALMISDIPFNGPISEVKVARIDGEFISNPSFEQLKESDIDMTVAGTDNAITMVEGESKMISEEEFLEALDYAHENIKLLNQLQRDLAEKVNKEKREYTIEEIPEEIVQLVEQTIRMEVEEYIHASTSKEERGEMRSAFMEKAVDVVTEHYEDNDDEEFLAKLPKYISKSVSDLEKMMMRRMILDEGRRLDGRKTTDIRPISCEVGLLPRAHGSALFTRGETQSLTTCTLGTERDEKMVDGLNPVFNENFMLHYNFPPFSTGEVGRMGLSRREVGHGHLAWRALKLQIPDGPDFSYTVRVVSDILESNGSSSMATVCAGSLAMFDAGIQIDKHVAGIAMGLIKEDDEVAILSDILGDEDFLGDMDFKVAGTVDGITAFQMDIKIEGLSTDIMKKALTQAKEGRMHILEIMTETIIQPRNEVSQYAPRFTHVNIPTDTIGAVIGSGGETIRQLCRDTNTEINIEDDGTVVIAATTKEDAEKARYLIEQLTRKPVEGEIYEATVKEIREGLGAIVEILPKTTALLHISQIAYEKTENVGDVLAVGDTLELKLIEVTRDGKLRVSRKALMEKPEGYVEPERKPRPSGGRRDDRRGGGRRDDRRGGGNYNR